MAHDDAESLPPRRDALNACATRKWHMQDPGYRSEQNGTCLVQRSQATMCAPSAVKLSRGGEAIDIGRFGVSDSCAVLGARLAM